MKIAMFGHKRLPSREGGIEVVVEELCLRLKALGHEVTVLNRRGKYVTHQHIDVEENQNYHGIQIRSVPTIDRKGLAAVSSSFFASLFCAFGSAEVIHIHAEGPAFFCWLPKLLGKHVVVTVHGLDWQREKWRNGFAAKYIRWGEKIAVRFADEIIVLSRNVQGYFYDTYKRETVWIPNGVNRPALVAAAQITNEFGLEKDNYLLFLGRLVPEKGIHYLIKAFQAVSTEKKLVISGGASDTDAYCADLKTLAGEDNRILFTGFVQGQLLEELYSNAYLYVLPSDTEGMPLSLLEAMSYGNGCLVSDIPECTEVVGEHAAVFPAGNIEKLREVLQELCDSPDSVARYKKNVREYICEKYNWDEVTKKTLELYR